MDLTGWAALGMMLTPFGGVEKLVSTQEAYQGFHDDGPILSLIRIDLREILDAKECLKLEKAIRAYSLGENVHAEIGKRGLQSGWAPWTRVEDESIEECERFPCAVKVTEPEVLQIRSTHPATERKAKYLELISDRIKRYLKSGVRGPRDRGGEPADPWELFERHGFRSPLSMPQNGTLWLRKVELIPGRARDIRQVIDRRFASKLETRTGITESTIWLRDIYSNHYFDSWGEWIHLSCDPGRKAALLIQGMMLEFDLLKKKDLLSRMARPKMRSGVKESGWKYLRERSRKLELVRSAGK